jgi:hypothetical protein
MINALHLLHPGLHAANLILPGLLDGPTQTRCTTESASLFSSSGGAPMTRQRSDYPLDYGASTAEGGTDRMGDMADTAADKLKAAGDQGPADDRKGDRSGARVPREGAGCCEAVQAIGQKVAQGSANDHAGRRSGHRLHPRRPLGKVAGVYSALWEAFRRVGPSAKGVTVSREAANSVNPALGTRVFSFARSRFQTRRSAYPRPWAHAVDRVERSKNASQRCSIRL